MTTSHFAAMECEKVGPNPKISCILWRARTTPYSRLLDRRYGMNFAGRSLFAVGGLVFSLTCLPMDAVADIGVTTGLPGFVLGTVGTEASACTNSACSTSSNVPNNYYVPSVGGAGGAVAATAAEFASNGVTAPAVVSAQAYINDLSLSISTCCDNPSEPLADGSGAAFAAFTDVLTFSSTAASGAVDAFVNLTLDPSASGSLAQLSLFWYGPGTGCDSTDYLSLDSCYTTQGPAVSFATIVLPGLTDADTLLVFMSLSGDASSGGSASDPASIIISNLPAGVSIISEGGGTYTATAAAVPEPSPVLLLSTLLFAVIFVVKKRIAQGL